MAADGTENESADAERPETGTSGEPAHQPPVHQPWVAGAGDQPSLPDVLPAHWQQQAPATNSGEAAADLLTTAVQSSSHEGGGVDPAVPASESEAAPADQGNTRRRSRRDEGERPARTRKPRRSRDEAAGDTSTRETTTGETGNGSGDMPASEATAAEPAPTETRSEAPAEPAEFAPIQQTSISSAPAPSVEAAHANGSGTTPSEATSEVTIIGEAASAEDAPKRRGWWRRLME
jgi:ribonuclease E